MPDITMCSDTVCPMAKDCRRSPQSGVKPNGDRQSWFLGSPRTLIGCGHFSPAPRLVTTKKETHD